MASAVRRLGSLSMARGCARIDAGPDTAKIGSADRVQVHHARLIAVIGVRKTYPHGLGQKRKCARSRGMSVRPSGADIVRLHRSGPVRAVCDILHRSTQHLIRSSGRRWHRGPYPRPFAEVSSGSAINITSEVIDHGHRPRPHRRCCSCLIISRASRRDAHLEIL